MVVYCAWLSVLVVVSLIVAICSGETYYGSGSFCDFKYDNTPMPRNNSSDMGISTTIEVLLSTTSYPSWSTSNNCGCTIKARGDRTMVDFNVKLMTNPKRQGPACSTMASKITMNTFYTCPVSANSSGITSSYTLKSGAAVTLELYNPHNSEVKAHVQINSNRPDVIITCDNKEEVTIPHNFCPCAGGSNTQRIGLINPQNAPTSKRLMIGFLAAFGFLICCGVILLLIFLIKRKEQKEKAEKEKQADLETNYSTINIQGNKFARNMAFESDTPPLPLGSRTPQSKSIDGIYATVDLSTGQTRLPFTPDTNLRLDLRTPNDSEVRSKYRGSTDSGLYSELSNERPNNNNTNKTPNHSFSGPYATSLDTLQSLGPEFKFEPPAGQSSPRLSPKSKEELDALYAKPMKRKKRKSKSQSKENVSVVEEPHKSSQQKLNTSAQISIEELPEYHPRPMGSRSGSSNIISHSMVSNAPSGSSNVLYLNRNGSRSDNELYATDTANESHGSRGTMTTDV